MTPTNESGHGLPEFLPCPFCGESNTDQFPCEWLDWSGANVVRCAWCHGAAPAKSWNRRAPAALALSRGVPADMVLVPRVPTDAMALAALKLSLSGHKSINGISVWHAMVEAAPAAPAAAGAQGEEDDSDPMTVLEAYAQGVTDALAGKHGAGSDPVMYQQIHRHLPNAQWTECSKATFDQYTNYHREYGGEPPVRALYAAPQPAAADGGVRERARELSDLIDRYWNLAYAEGKEGRDHDTDNGDAALCRYEIEKHLRALSSHRQAGDEAATLRWAAAVLDMWEGDPNETGYMGDFGDACAILNLLADHAPYTAPPPGPDLSKFRELAEGWTQHGEALHANGFDIRGAAMHKCARELLALVEKGAGNGR